MEDHFIVPVQVNRLGEGTEVLVQHRYIEEVRRKTPLYYINSVIGTSAVILCFIALWYLVTSLSGRTAQEINILEQPFLVYFLIIIVLIPVLVYLYVTKNKVETVVKEEKVKLETIFFLKFQ